MGDLHPRSNADVHQYGPLVCTQRIDEQGVGALLTQAGQRKLLDKQFKKPNLWNLEALQVDVLR